ncbi:helix-turn-helix domain-containing protein [Mucilaginibacter sp. X5P1]|uniref:AlbA family DNA-binding domain-containing protein n=1 Tax=Mucilaginibacter sp. X5P1 TaxID=2723088 RepID=UPI001617B4B1|nr:ATP-binding protein [Mucilaginibacter sp. X5P1]MBB6141833.1 hypothetical protein [Mucilaginibacter sp. X5P1]
MNKYINELKEIVQNEGESRNIDFKKTEYPATAYTGLLKDVMAMANINYAGPRFIICGVELKNDTEKIITGIDNPTDSSRYAQLINENIEPEIQFEYVHFQYDNKILTAFIIHGCSDQPYMMRKDYTRLQKGESFIRKGSSTSRLIRADIDRIFEQRSVSIFFQGEVELFFEETNSNHLEIKIIEDFELPSIVFKRRAERVIREKENRDYITQAYDHHRPTGPQSELSLEHMNVNEIRSLISVAATNFADEDTYAIREHHSYKLNATIQNNGEEYIRNASFEIEIDSAENLLVPEKIYCRQINLNTSNGVSRGYAPDPPANLNEGYPTVNKSNGKYLIKQAIGDLKHGIPENLFKAPLRIAIVNPGLRGTETILKIRIFGENLQRPISKVLNLKFT